MSKFELFVNSYLKKVNHLPGNTLNWCSILLGHCVFVPTLLAILIGLSDNTPTIDVFLFVQGILFLSFLRSIVAKDVVAMVLHALGWFVQVLLFSLIMFK